MGPFSYTGTLVGIPEPPSDSKWQHWNGPWALAYSKWLKFAFTAEQGPSRSPVHVAACLPPCPLTHTTLTGTRQQSKRLTEGICNQNHHLILFSPDFIRFLRTRLNSISRTLKRSQETYLHRKRLFRYLYLTKITSILSVFLIESNCSNHFSKHHLIWGFPKNLYFLLSTLNT